VKKWALGIAMGLALLPLILLGFLVGTAWNPPDELSVPVTCSADAPAAPVDRPLSILVWNTQYGASRNYAFFYDGGDAVRVEKADVMATLQGIRDVIIDLDPDIILWQEIDRNSARTHHVDQLEWLQGALRYPCEASTPYHKVAYLPYPAHEFSGRVQMDLAVFSKFKMNEATRHQLAMLDEPSWRRAMNLKRAILEVAVALEDGRELHLLNTHLSAFSKNDGTLEKQMEQLQHRASALDAKRIPWVLAGDFNALYPGDSLERIPDGDIYYTVSPTPVERLYNYLEPVLPLAQLKADPPRWYTYIPYGARQPDRVLDYAFRGRATQSSNYQVQQVLDLSDHLPLTFDLTIPSETP